MHFLLAGYLFLRSPLIREVSRPVRFDGKPRRLVAPLLPGAKTGVHRPAGRGGAGPRAGAGRGLWDRELSLFLAQQGHEVLGMDISPRAVATAREKARWRRIPAEFAVRDALALDGLARAGLSFRTTSTASRRRSAGHGSGPPTAGTCSGPRRRCSSVATPETGRTWGWYAVRPAPADGEQARRPDGRRDVDRDQAAFENGSPPPRGAPPERSATQARQNR